MDGAGVTLTKDVPIKKYVDWGISGCPTQPTAVQSTRSQHQTPAIRFGFTRLSPPPVPITSLSSCRPGFP